MVASLSRKGLFRTTALAGALAVSLAATGAYAQEAQPRTYNIPAQSLAESLRAYGLESGEQIIFAERMVSGRQAPALQGTFKTDEALGILLADSGLTATRTASGGIMIRSASDPQSGSAAGDGADQGTVQALIVTAQKREENIQDVPIAMSAFTQEELTRSQVAGGPDLITQVPNMTFTKTNFSSYSIQLRGIGTQAISATVDPAVAVAFNNTPFIRNRFFEQEFYDLQRVEVLRGPQGTLYGRNATAGVVNLISQKAKLGTYEAKLSADVANYGSSRVEGMINIPLAEDVAALRIAGAWTKRKGYSVNELTGNPIDGRDLWSTRVSLRFAPTERLDANLIWEHFQEDDDRLRSGKQLCKTDIVTQVAGFATPDFYGFVPEWGLPQVFSGIQPSFSQGCTAASLYSPDSYQKTNPLALPYYVPLGAVGLPVAQYPIGHPFAGMPVDPYASRTQSSDLRVIESPVEPGYRAKTDVVELQANFDISNALTLSSETSWASDFIFSTQDYNRFAGAPNAWSSTGGDASSLVDRGILNAKGEFCDPQIGCSDRLVAMDLSTARSTQFSQELRLASDFDGPFNFSLGGNFLRYDTEDKYYVFINSVTMIAARNISGVVGNPMTPWEPGVTDNRGCLTNGMIGPDYSQAQRILLCTYIDPNSIDSLNDLGHNYFLSRNPYKLISYAAFGEAYYNIADNLKVTAGLRWTVDKKEAPVIPSWLLAANTVGYPVVEIVEQEWRKPTGRVAIDWKPNLAFTDETMIYASVAHGYKAGGMNPPPYGKAILTFGIDDALGDLVTTASATHPKTFDPEYVNAFELGSKNTLANGALTLNLAAFYYDYDGYQLSQIVDRSAVTDNFDATVWGLELEADWRAAENLRLGLKLGYEQTKVADGEQAIDVMDRTAGNKNWVLVKPFPSLPSNCVLPAWMFVGNTAGGNVLGAGPNPSNPALVNVGGKGGGNPGGCELTYLMRLDPAYTLSANDGQIPAVLPNFRQGINYAAWSDNIADYPCAMLTSVPTTPINYPGVDLECLRAMSNNGEGFFKDLSGNELPNAPNLTATITADYTVPLPSEWLMTLHTDLYYQAESWTRIFNTEGYDKLKAYTNVNVAAIFTNEPQGWKVMAYVKNVFDRDSITGAFLNSDDSGLTTNVFLTEPRLYGIRVTKDFAGGPWWTGANLEHEGPFPLTIELGGQIQRHDGAYERLTTPWVDTLPESIALEEVQNRDLDTGDGRSLKLTWRPEGSAWSVSASAWGGKTNNDTARTNAASADVTEVCGWPEGIFYAVACQPPYTLFGVPNGYFNFVQSTSWSDAEARSREEYEAAAFAVGYDRGFGSGLQSTISAELRFASFRSETSWAANAQTDWDIPEGWFAAFLGAQYETSFARRHAALSAEREFDGAGPALSWQAAMPVWGDADKGRLNVDWSLAAGALFGERKTAVSGTDRTVIHQGDLGSAVTPTGDRMLAIVTSTLPTAASQPDPVVIDIARTGDATVPLLDLSLGLSYDVGRIKLSTGYRWERYFDVLDVGYRERKEADRTIDGPYFKIAVGFGG
jgi:outer membrane receptor protein involved in Fe transport